MSVKICLLLFCLLLAVLASGCCSDFHANEQYMTANVTGKFIDPAGDSGSSYVIITDKGNLEVDRPLLDAFNQERNPDRIYAEIQVNHTYIFHTYGYPFDLTYSYPIIVGVKEPGGQG